MATSMIFAAVLAVCSVVTPDTTTSDKEQGKSPEHQVVAIYFHRTQRCPTCKRIGAMAEEAVTKGFEKEVENRTVEFHYIDFQDEKNAELAKKYGIETPTLVMINVFEGETVCLTSMPKVWQLVGKPDDFRAYVQDGVARYLRQSKEDAEQERDESKESKE
ncbi:nitrophenyl compound nitroreductase subunit ArsF family protein [Bythopirellula goksoeyrii]|uniref:Thioredoxin domain-containing protein n=1 Tax=Bythopirellula goksoeyrii TaxID=1400387 RepID=A0A5B9QSF7_9BACT|nr:nitrophenyl compound nitroreductase subunit ArsF family protein [Bythopirellula goksoeyrii]QEG37071.1 hypothetical protein Pr1d_44110 [Bythopirellula goksoeyrii]